MPFCYLNRDCSLLVQADLVKKKSHYRERPQTNKKHAFSLARRFFPLSARQTSENVSLVMSASKLKEIQSASLLQKGRAIQILLGGLKKLKEEIKEVGKNDR